MDIASIPRHAFDEMARSHDSSLPLWGPYSKVTAGVSRIACKDRGAAFELSVFPAVYRGRSMLPTATVQSNYHPWYAAPDLSEYAYRFQLEWKDRLYCDVRYRLLEEDGVLVEMEARNETELPQQIGFHYLASMQFPRDGVGFARWLQPEADEETFFLDGTDYTRLEPAVPHHQDHLVYDGRFRCEVTGSGLVRGRGLGDRFGKTPGDTVEYTFPDSCAKHSLLTLRVKGHGHFQLDGCVREAAVFGCDDFSLYTFPWNQREGEQTLTLTCISGSGITIDMLAVSDSPVRFLPEEPWYRPELSEEGNLLTLKYRDDQIYGILWEGSDHMTREILGSDWPRLMDHYVMDHVAATLSGDGEAHYTDLYARPFFLQPHSGRKFRALVCKDPTPERIRKLRQLAGEAHPLPPEQDLSIRLLRATLMTNVVYPIYVQGEYIRHFTPGKWWDSLYTWDCGFISLGLSTISDQLALDVLNCYLTQPGNMHAAFIHHGSPIPVQAYAYKALWDKSGNRDFLASFYPRMKQYYAFLMGRIPTSATRNMASGLLNTFAYFYNSGGWDDLPPQAEVHRLGIGDTTCPAVSSVHAIVFARILRHASALLGLGEEAGFDRDIEELSTALQRHSWDEEAGFFSYVTHDASGAVTGILRDASGMNLNRTLDGAEAILAGICTPEQEQRLANAIMDPRHFWTDCGVTTVDQSAPYYRTDGYWNGAVWMAHQWFVFLAFLAICRPEDSVKIARTALEVWKRETEASYNCYEHFIPETGRGCGWHQFGGLSAPVLLWHQTLFTPGTVTVPPATFVLKSDFSGDFRTASITVSSAPSLRKRSSLLVTMAPGNYRVTLDSREIPHKVYDNALSLEIPDGKECIIRIEEA